MSSTALFVHVPVDEIEIAWGDQSGQDLFFFMGRTDPVKALTMSVNLKTSASNKIFQRKLTITQVLRMTGRGKREVVTFRGTFASQPVQGTYCPHTRSGRFSAAL